jgi:opacity protein-like surface antigen
MFTLRATLAGLALLAASTMPVMAADLGDMREDARERVDMDSDSNARFYLRGDASLAWYRSPSMSENGLSLTNNSLGRAWAYGGGIGWYVSPNWRMDITVEHRGDASASGYLTVPGDTTLTGTREFSVNSNVALANLYYDFSGRAGFNPYIGAGIGWSSNHAHNGTAVETCGCIASIEDAGKSNFAWALMAGVTKELDHGFSLDAGYRLINIGGVHTGNLVQKTGAVVSGSDLTSGNIYANEIRLGLRYDIF